MSNLDELLGEPYLVAVGFRGKLSDKSLGVNTLEAYKERNAEIIREGVGFPLLTPLIESNPVKKPITIRITDDEDLTEKVRQAYSELCNPSITSPKTFFPSPFGDFIQLHRLTDGVYSMRVSHNAFQKAALAADLSIAIRGVNEAQEPVVYLVTGVRKNDPGKGLPAWIGGFRDVKDGVLDSSAYTLLHEAVEEAGLEISHHDPESLRRDYAADNIPVTVKLGGALEFNARMHYLDTIATSDLPLREGGESLPDGSKRVYVTDGYLVVVNVGDNVISDDVLSEWFTASSDIQSLLFSDITEHTKKNLHEELRGKLRFGIEHHNDFIKPLVGTLYELY